MDVVTYNKTRKLEKNVAGFSEAYSEELSLNLFNPTYLTGAGWTFNASTGEYVGTPMQLRRAYSYILPITFKPNTKYLLMFNLYTEGNQGTTDTYGFVITFYQTDGTVSQQKIKNTQTTSTHVVISTYANMSSRSLDRISVVYESLGENIWHLTNVMLVEGYIATDTDIPEYEPYGSKTVYTAIDFVSRNTKLNANLGVSEAGKQLVVDSDGSIIAEEKAVLNGSKYSDVLLYRDKIPEYYLSFPSEPASFDDDDYLDSKISKIPDGKQMLFFTDTHWESNAKHSIPIMQYVRGRAGIKNVLYGGDFIDRRNNKYLAKQTLTDFSARCMSAFGENMFTTIGNHDTNMANYNGDDKSSMYLPFTILHNAFFTTIRGKIYTQAELDYTKITAMTEDADDLSELLAYFSTIYYYDDESQRIRYVVVNTGNNQYGAVNSYVKLAYNQELRIQYDFVDYALRTVPTEWDIVLFGHDLVPWNGTAFSWHDEARIMFDMLGRRKMKRSGSISIPDHETLNSWYGTDTYTYDYTSLPDVGKCAVIFGHTHRDAILNTYYNNDGYIRLNQPYDGTALNQDTTGKIPLICTTTDAYVQATSGDYGVPMELGTITEQAFDVISITETQLLLTRFGAGSDRVVTF